MESRPSSMAVSGERLAMNPHVSQSAAYQTGWCDEAATKFRQLRGEAQELIPRVCQLAKLMDCDSDTVQLGDKIWQSGIVPNSPRLCSNLLRSFPGHPANLEPDKVDNAGLRIMQRYPNIGSSVGPWYQLLVRVADFRAACVPFLNRVAPELSSFQSLESGAIQAFMGLFCDYCRLCLLTQKTGKKLILQLQAFIDYFQDESAIPDGYQRVLGFVLDYDDPLQGLQQDLRGLGPVMGRALEAMGPSLERWWDPKGVLRDLFLGPFGPDLATVGTGGSQDEGGDRLAGQAQELAERVNYAGWLVLGLLCCPSEILNCSHRTLGTIKAVLRSSPSLLLHEAQALWVHPLVRQWVLPVAVEAKRGAALRMHKKIEDPASPAEADIQRSYRKALEVSRTLGEVLSAQGDSSPARIPQKQQQQQQQQHRQQWHTAVHSPLHHSLRRPETLSQQAGRLLLLLRDKPQLLATKLPFVCAVLAHSRGELLEHLQRSLPRPLSTPDVSPLDSPLMSPPPHSFASSDSSWLYPASPLPAPTARSRAAVNASHVKVEETVAADSAAASLLYSHFQLQLLVFSFAQELRGSAAEHCAATVEAASSLLDGDHQDDPLVQALRALAQAGKEALALTSSAGATKHETDTVTERVADTGTDAETERATGTGTDTVTERVTGTGTDAVTEAEGLAGRDASGPLGGKPSDGDQGSAREREQGEEGGRASGNGAAEAWAAYRHQLCAASLWLASRQEEAGQAGAGSGTSKALALLNDLAFWSRCLDSVEGVVLEHSSLHQLWHFRPQLSTLLRHTLSEPTAEPWCALGWLGVPWALLNGEDAGAKGGSSPEEQEEGEWDDAWDFADTVLEALACKAEMLLASVVDHSLEGSGATDFASSSSAPPSWAGAHEAGLEGMGHIQGQGRGVGKLEVFVDIVAAAADLGPVRMGGGEELCPLGAIEARLGGAVRRCLRGALILRDGRMAPPADVEASLGALSAALLSAQQRCPTNFSALISQALLAEPRGGSQVHPLEAPGTPAETGARPPHPLALSPLPGAGAVDGVGLRRSAMEEACHRLLVEVVLDSTGSGVVFSPALRGFRSTLPHAGGVLAQELLSFPQMQSFACVFGLPGVNSLASGIVQVLVALVSHLDATLASKQQLLSRLGSAMPVAGEKAQAQALGWEYAERREVLGVCIQIGACLHALEVVGDACGSVMEGEVPALFGILQSVACHLRRTIPEPTPAVELRKLAARCGAAAGVPELGPQSEEALWAVLDAGCGGGGAGREAAWDNLPVLLASLLASDLWEGCAYHPVYQDFSNNANCLAKCIHALVEASERAEAERAGIMKALLAEQMTRRGAPRDGRRGEDKALPTVESVRCSASSKLKQFAHQAAFLALADTDSCSRGSWASRVIFLDMLCESSAYLPRSVLEEVLPSALVRAAYNAYLETPYASHAHPHAHSHSHSHGQAPRPRWVDAEAASTLWNPLFPSAHSLQVPFGGSVALSILAARAGLGEDMGLSVSSSASSTGAAGVPGGASGGAPGEGERDDAGSSNLSGEVHLEPAKILRAYGALMVGEKGDAQLLHSSLESHAGDQEGDSSPNTKTPAHRRRWYARQDGYERVATSLGAIDRSRGGGGARDSSLGTPADNLRGSQEQAQPQPPGGGGANGGSLFSRGTFKAQSGLLGPALRDRNKSTRDQRRKAVSGPMHGLDLPEGGAPGAAGAPGAGQGEGSLPGAHPPAEGSAGGGREGLRGSWEDQGHDGEGGENSGRVLSAIKGFAFGKPTPSRPGLSAYAAAAATPTPAPPSGSKWSGALSAISGRLRGTAKGAPQAREHSGDTVLSPPRERESPRDTFLDEMFGSMLEEAAGEPNVRGEGARGDGGRARTQGPGQQEQKREEGGGGGGKEEATRWLNLKELIPLSPLAKLDEEAFEPGLLQQVMGVEVGDAMPTAALLGLKSLKIPDKPLDSPPPRQK